MEKTKVLFRGFRADGMGWVKGDLLQNYIHHEGFLTIVENGCINYKVITSSVGQFVANVFGLELWEGDLIRVNNLETTWRSEPNFDWRLFAVTKNRYVWALNNSVMYFPLREEDPETLNPYDVTLVGNTNDNPELVY